MTSEATRVWVPGGPFTMGSDAHYPEEGPVHQVHVDGFWIDAFEVTNADFAAFVEATGYVTVAERPLDPADYPGAPAENLVPGSLVFTPTPGPVDLRHLNQWWTWVPGASWRHPEGPGADMRQRLDHPVVHVRPRGRRRLLDLGGVRPADRGGVGVRRSRRAGGCRVHLG